MMKKTIIEIIAIPHGIQIGHVTHHHDQSITLHNLRTINAIVKNPANEVPIPLISALSLLILLILYLF